MTFVVGRYRATQIWSLLGGKSGPQVEKGVRLELHGEQKGHQT
jgi:hypothetical protein